MENNDLCVEGSPSGDTGIVPRLGRALTAGPRGSSCCSLSGFRVRPDAGTEVVFAERTDTLKTCTFGLGSLAAMSTPCAKLGFELR